MIYYLISLLIIGVVLVTVGIVMVAKAKKMKMNFMEEADQELIDEALESLQED